MGGPNWKAEECGDSVRFGHVAFTIHIKHSRSDEDIALVFRRKVRAGDTSLGVYGISRE